jgi:adenosylcobinamide-GDP ribazoletransferase
MRRAISFLTPFGGVAVPSAATPTWFPAVGALLGAVLGLLWWGTDRLWPPLVAAALVVAADLALTGMLHLDGLADTADGVLPPLERRRRLEVMSQPDVGAFGVGATGTVLLLRWAALAAMVPSIGLLVGLWCASRTAMAVIVRRLPYAREGGLASAFRGGRALPVGLAGSAAALVAATAARGGAGAAAVVACLLGAAAVATLAHRRLGGFTGDVVGAAGLVGETVGLVVAAARW